MTTQRTLRIDDEMLNRARAAFLDLEAALSPYLERRNGERRATAGVNGSAPHSAQEGQNKAPEIFVSDGMELAGQNAANADAVYFWNTTAARVYRAMEAQRRKEQGQ